MNDPNFLGDLGTMLDAVFDNNDHVMVDVTADPFDFDRDDACPPLPDLPMPADFCTRCAGHGTRGGVEWLPAMTFTDARTGKVGASTAGYGFVSRLCRACNGTGLRINGKRKLQRLAWRATCLRDVAAMRADKGGG